MDYTNITPEEAKNLIQNAQAEILEQYDEFVNKVSKTSIESKELIENDEKNNADELLDTLDE